jgi:hypothetical protein
MLTLRGLISQTPRQFPQLHFANLPAEQGENREFFLSVVHGRIKPSAFKPEGKFDLNRQGNKQGTPPQHDIGSPDAQISETERWT